ncbi:LOW QUALITY PROTEIN: ELMO/CED-12 family-domain-containing protein, partial [Jimgerdemannia flammicorona]
LPARFLNASLSRIADSYRLVSEINSRTHTTYDQSKQAHERKLMEVGLLWAEEGEGKRLYVWFICRISTTFLMQIGVRALGRPHAGQEARWSHLQPMEGGKDPATDFRGMGMLGLDDLVYYAKTYPESARRVLVCAHHPVSWYPFACVGLNITKFAVQTLRTRQLQYFLFEYGTTKETLSLPHLQRVLDFARATGPNGNGFRGEISAVQGPGRAGAVGASGPDATRDD